MWLVTTLIAAIVATAIWKMAPKNDYRFDTLAMMLWGMEVMIIVDHILGYEGGAFLETETDGLVANSFVLGALMIAAVLGAWLAYLGIVRFARKKNVTEG